MADESPVKAKKRKWSAAALNKQNCFICQEYDSNLSRLSDAGKERVVEVIAKRKTMNDTKYEHVKNVYDKMSKEHWATCILYKHKSCYSTFTSKKMIHKLKTVSKSPDKKAKKVTRQNVAFSKDKCVFCQNQNTKKLHRVMSYDVSQKIIEYSKLCEDMSRKLANFTDLIAADIQYHLPCYISFKRRIEKVKLKLSESGICKEDDNIKRSLVMVCKNLRNGLTQGNTYILKDVYADFLDACSSENTTVNDPSKVFGRKPFYEYVRNELGDIASFVTDKGLNTYIYPKHMTGNILLQAWKKDDNNEKQKSGLSSESEITDDEFDTNAAQSIGVTMGTIANVALEIRSDLEKTEGNPSWVDLNEESAANIVPDTLYIFLNVLCGGVNSIGIEEEDVERRKMILSLAQDIIFTVSKGKKLTPKHVGLGLSLHHSTRSTNLVDMFNKANASIGSGTIKRIDTAIADTIINRANERNGVFVPDQLIPGRPIHYSCDNIDVQDCTVDGKNTFHCTQMVAWQRGILPIQNTPVSTKHGRKKSLPTEALDEFHRLDRPIKGSYKTEPPEEYAVKLEWFEQEHMTESEQAHIINSAWSLARWIDTEKINVPTWNHFNVIACENDPPISSIGLYPIIRAHADDDDTIATVMNRCISTSTELEQTFTVITGDQPLYSRMTLLKWANPTVYTNVITRLGGLHICFNFLKCIGQHMESSGLEELWTEAGIYSENVTTCMMQGKAYYRAVRGHLLVYEALTSLRLDHIKTWGDENDHKIDDSILLSVQNVIDGFQEKDEEKVQESMRNLVNTTNSFEKYKQLMKDFDNYHDQNPNYKFWLSYMEMVEILMNFIRAERKGNWKLHLESFAAMLPWLTIYDHTNYARFGPVYLNDMMNLENTAYEVFLDFLNGNFGVKFSPGRFNQVAADHGTEWINKMTKSGQGGIIGITQNKKALDRFCVTWSQRSQILNATKAMLGIQNNQENEGFSRNDNSRSSISRDNNDVIKLKNQMKIFNIFQINVDPNPEGEYDLISLSTKDVAPPEVEQDLLTAKERGERER